MLLHNASIGMRSARYKQLRFINWFWLIYVASPIIIIIIIIIISRHAYDVVNYNCPLTLVLISSWHSRLTRSLVLYMHVDIAVNCSLATVRTRRYMMQHRLIIRHPLKSAAPTYCVWMNINDCSEDVRSTIKVYDGANTSFVILVCAATMKRYSRPGCKRFILKIHYQVRPVWHHSVQYCRYLCTLNITHMADQSSLLDNIVTLSSYFMRDFMNIVESLLSNWRDVCSPAACMFARTLQQDLPLIWVIICIYIYIYIYTMYDLCVYVFNRIYTDTAYK